MTKDMVYMGPLIGWIDPTLRALDERCSAVADDIVAHAEDEHPLFKMRRPFAGSTPVGTIEVVEHFRIYSGPRHVIAIDHDPGDEDRTP